MKKIKCYICIDSHDFSSYYNKDNDWGFRPEETHGINRINWLSIDELDKASQLVSKAHELNILPVVVVSDTSFECIFKIDGDFEILNTSFDALKLRIFLNYPREILDSYFAVFDRSFETIDWELYKGKYDWLSKFSKRIIESKIDGLSSSDKEYVARVNQSLNFDEFTKAESNSFYHPALPIFCIEPISGICELPLANAEIKSSLISNLKKRISDSSEENHIVTSLWDDLVKLITIGANTVRTVCKISNISEIELNAATMQMAHATSASTEDALLLNAAFPIALDYRDNYLEITVLLIKDPEIILGKITSNVIFLGEFLEVSNTLEECNDKNFALITSKIKTTGNEYQSSIDFDRLYLQSNFDQKRSYINFVFYI